MSKHVYVSLHEHSPLGHRSMHFQFNSLFVSSTFHDANRKSKPLNVFYLLVSSFFFFMFRRRAVDHTRVILKDVDSSSPGAEYINANYIRPLEGEQNADLTSMASLENLNTSYATLSNHGKCVNCQLLNKMCVQCSIDGGHNNNKHKRTESLSSIRSNFSVMTKKNDDFISKTYIATQGCLPNTIVDFWSMIWQENTRVIVMTTKEIERTKKKCEKYWPDPGQQQEWGHAKVTCLTETSTNDYTLREMLFSWRGREERKIFQYHFLVWPDHGVPTDPGCVLNFLQDVNARQEQLMGDSVNPVSFQRF